MTTFHNEMTGMVDEGKAVVPLYLHFSKGFDSVSCKSLRDKLLYGPDQPVGCELTGSWYKKVVISRTMPI